MLPVSADGDEFGVYKNISRINHSCQPNCVHYQLRNSSENDAKSNTEQVRSMKTIEKGEEITISYRCYCHTHIFINFSFLQKSVTEIIPDLHGQKDISEGGAQTTN